jgi:uncharacterized protein (DUF1778 family)
VLEVADMATRDSRLEVRLDPECKARIEQAAKLGGLTVSAFVLDVVMAATDRALARLDVTLMSAEQFDELAASLETANSAPELVRLAQRERRYVRR